MSTNKPWSYRTTQDKLLIFVSSRIQECKEERAIVQSAIVSVGHQPVLFEHIGARPYSPRDLYLSRLSDSQIMVAIYRSGYGYIDSANGMSISGLEDEYRFAKREGIETLFYVWQSEVGRDARLSALLDEIRGGPTIALYDDPKQLYEFVRRNLNAVITDRFLAASAQSGVIQEDSADVLARALRRVGVVVFRKQLVEELGARSLKESVLCVTGPAGIGKTTITAQLSQTIGARYLRASGLAPKELFGACVGVITRARPLEVPVYSTLEGARLALASAWSESDDLAFIVDECEFIPELLDALSAGGGTSPKKRLIYTSRDPSLQFPNIEIPPLTTAEIAEIVAGVVTEQEVDSRVFDSGNPLHLQHMLMTATRTPSTIDSTSIKGPAGEVLTYLAISPTPLSAEDLLQLRSDSSYSITALVDDIQHLGPIVDDSPRGYRLIHQETAATIANELKKSAQRYRFFVNRLIRLAENAGSARFAYELALSLEDGSERRYATAAIRESARLGDWRLGVQIIDRLLSAARDGESKLETLHLMLSLVHPLELMGDASRGSELLDRARSLAEALGESAVQSVREVELSSSARRALAASDVKELERIHKHYGDQHRDWDKARLGLELSAIYIAAKNYELAVDMLRPTLAAFERLGDEYGVDLSQRNLASSLSAIPSGQEEAERLIELISSRTTDEPDNRRQRAWLCNLLTRRYRTEGNYDKAEALAKESIEIAEQLGDESLRAINLVNLGNVLRGKKSSAAAIEAYEEAAKSAKKSARQDIEADASRLIASILNDFPETGVDRRVRAKLYAQHAVGLLRGSVYGEARALAAWELAEAHEELREWKPAAQSMFEAAGAFGTIPDLERLSHALVYATNLALPDHPHIYLQGIVDVLNIAPPSSDQILIDQFLELILPIMRSAPREALISVLGRHVSEIWSHMPPIMRRGLASHVVEMFGRALEVPAIRAENWRVLYAAIAFAALLKDTAQPYLHHKLAEYASRAVDDVFVREDGDGARTWTVVLDVGHRLTISIEPLDVSAATNLASFALAMFIKAFENELYRELIGGPPLIDELSIQVASYEEMPADLRRAISPDVDLRTALEDQTSAVSRPVNFNGSIPTVVFLSPSFLEKVSFGEERGASLQLLFGLTLMEIAFQLLRGEVEADTLKPKLLSLVRKTRL